MSQVGTNQEGFGVLEALLIMITLGLLILAGWFVYHTKNETKPASTTTTPVKTTPVAAPTNTTIFELKDSGSTNRAGWDFMLFSDGSGAVSGDSSGLRAQATAEGGDTQFPANTFVVSSVVKSLSTTHLNSAYTCIRSVSFGSVETLIYSGKTVTGIDCYLGSNPQTPLAIDLNKILNKANL